MGQKFGFTLIELLIVISICGLIISISFPTLTNFKENFYLDALARERASEIRKVQSLAMGKGEVQSIGRFKFSRTGSPLPGGTGTEILEGRSGRSKKIIVSSIGRVRIE